MKAKRIAKALCAAAIAAVCASCGEDYEWDRNWDDLYPQDRLSLCRTKLYELLDARLIHKDGHPFSGKELTHIIKRYVDMIRWLSGDVGEGVLTMPALGKGAPKELTAEEQKRMIDRLMAWRDGGELFQYPPRKMENTASRCFAALGLEPNIENLAKILQADFKPKGKEDTVFLLELLFLYSSWDKPDSEATLSWLEIGGKRHLLYMTERTASLFFDIPAKTIGEKTVIREEECTITTNPAVLRKASIGEYNFLNIPYFKKRHRDNDDSDEIDKEEP